MTGKQLPRINLFQLSHLVLNQWLNKLFVKEVLDDDAITLLGKGTKESKSGIAAMEFRKIEIEIDKYKLHLQVLEKE